MYVPSRPSAFILTDWGLYCPIGTGSASCLPTSTPCYRPIETDLCCLSRPTLNYLMELSPLGDVESLLFNSVSSYMAATPTCGFLPTGAGAADSFDCAASSDGPSLCKPPVTPGDALAVWQLFTPLFARYTAGAVHCCRSRSGMTVPVARRPSFRSAVQSIGSSPIPRPQAEAGKRKAVGQADDDAGGAEPSVAKKANTSVSLLELRSLQCSAEFADGVHLWIPCISLRQVPAAAARMGGWSRGLQPPLLLLM